MSETSGSCAVIANSGIMSRYPQRSVMDDLCDAYEKRQMVKQEIRKQELEEKGENGGLTTREAMELSGYKIQEGLEKMAKLTKPTVCYMA